MGADHHGERVFCVTRASEGRAAHAAKGTSSTFLTWLAWRRWPSPSALSLPAEAKKRKNPTKPDEGASPTRPMASR